MVNKQQSDRKVTNSGLVSKPVNGQLSGTVAKTFKLSVTRSGAGNKSKRQIQDASRFTKLKCHHWWSAIKRITSGVNTHTSTHQVYVCYCLLPYDVWFDACSVITSSQIAWQELLGQTASSNCKYKNHIFIWNSRRTQISIIIKFSSYLFKNTP
jgi:hypothetical protein